MDAVSFRLPDDAGRSGEVMADVVNSRPPRPRAGWSDGMPGIRHTACVSTGWCSHTSGASRGWTLCRSISRLAEYGDGRVTCVRRRVCDVRVSQVEAEGGGVNGARTGRRAARGVRKDLPQLREGVRGVGGGCQGPIFCPECRGHLGQFRPISPVFSPRQCGPTGGRGAGARLHHQLGGVCRVGGHP